MRSCPGRLSHLGHRVLCPLLLAVAIFFLYSLPSFIKEPSTKPSRYQYTENTEEGVQEPVQKTTPQIPTTGWGTSVHVVQENRVPDTHRGQGVAWHSTADSRRAKAPPSPTNASLLKRNTANTVPPRGQDKQKASVRIEPPAERSGVTKAAGGSGQPTGRLSTARTTLTRNQDKASTAKTLVPESRRNKITPTPTAGAAMTTTRTRKNAMTAAAPPAKKEPRVTPAPAPVPSPTAQKSQRLKAADFKSEPRWDFEENYTMDEHALKTTCPDSVKIRASRSPWLQHLFLTNITLFMDSRHFNEREWKRLEHFKPPFGFMELNRSLVEKVVTRFPPVPQQQLLLADLPPGSPHCVTCAVVGNGGILNNSRMGREIDSHDYVFRLSGAVIKGFEEDVGTRTSFYGFTAFSLTQSLLILGGRGFRHVPLGKDVRYLHFLEGPRDYEWLEALVLNQTLQRKNLSWFRRRPQTAFQEALQLDKYLLLHPDFLRYMKNRFLRSKNLNTAHWKIYRPTTGALLLLTALQLCDKVSAYGFITEGHERFSDHYYDKSWKRLVFYINHDFKLEKAVWKRLHDEGIIWLYQRPKNPNAKN